MISPAAVLNRARERRPFLDHLVRTIGRYQADTGDRLAAAVTFYWFLSLFPILLLAISILGFALGDDARTQIVSGLSGYLPKGVASSVGDVVAANKGKAGIIGLIGTLLSGLGWISALREAIRTVWHQNVTYGNIVTSKIRDSGVLLGLFAVITASVIVSGATTASTGAVLSFLGLGDTPGVSLFLQALGYVIGGVIDVVVFLYMFSRLARVRSPLRRLLKGAVFGAVGFELVKYVGAIYVARTTSKGEATYGTFAVVVGLLLFLNLVSRVVLFAAAFTVTAPYDSDIAPSGTADVEQARKAGMPERYADSDENLQEDGAPAPLRAAVQGRTPSQDEPEGRAAVAAGQSSPTASDEGTAQSARPGPAGSGQSARLGTVDPGQAARPGRAASPAGSAPGRSAAAGPDPLQGAAAVQLAARVFAGVLGAGVLGVLVFALRSLRGVLRR